MDEMQSGAGYQAGYNDARSDLRMLLGKVEENAKLGVVRAWLMEEIDEDG